MAMNKIKSKELYRKSGIPTPEYEIVSGGFNTPQYIHRLTSRLGLPLVLKVPKGGSSLGVLIAETAEEVRTGLEEMNRQTGRLLVERYIKGREATCGYIQNFKPLPPTEIIPLEDSFFNYEAKYDPARTREVTPGDFPSRLTREMQKLAAECHDILGLSVYSRTDFLLADGRLYVLETNSLPGFTSASILPQEAKETGLDYRDLLTKIIEESIKK
jgi:D-alanine-D-alanine ligase